MVFVGGQAGHLFVHLLYREITSGRDVLPPRPDEYSGGCSFPSLYSGAFFIIKGKMSFW